MEFGLTAKDRLCVLFSNDQQPSMKVHTGYLDHDGYYCWACGAGGTIFNFAMDYCNMDFESAVKYVAEEFGIRIADEYELSQEEKLKIVRQKQMRALNAKFDSLHLRALSALSQKIRFYEKVKQAAEPFGELFCWLSDQLPVLQGQWEELYEEIYGKKGNGTIWMRRKYMRFMWICLKSIRNFMKKTPFSNEKEEFIQKINLINASHNSYFCYLCVTH